MSKPVTTAAASWEHVHAQELERIKARRPARNPGDADSDDPNNATSATSATDTNGTATVAAADDIATVAVCLSGGGIRSATFNLGVLQGLASAIPGWNLLKCVDYLSTVSGGGYIGSWLSAWQWRAAQVGEKPLKQLEDPGVAVAPKPAEPIRHLREYSNYLSPKLSLLTGDGMTLAATYVRNLLLVWLMLLPLLAVPLCWPHVLDGLTKVLNGPASQELARALLWVAALGTLPPIAWAVYSRVRTGGSVAKGADKPFLLAFVLPHVASVTAAGLYIAFAPKEWTLANHRLAVLGVVVAVMVLATALAMAATARSGGGREAIIESAMATPLGCAATFVLLALAYRYLGRDAGLAAAHPTTALALTPPAVTLSVLVGSFVATGILSSGRHDDTREWWARVNGWMLFTAAAHALLCVLALGAPKFFSTLGPELRRLALAAAPVLSVLAPMLASSRKAPADPKQAGPTLTAVLFSKLMSLLGVLAILSVFFLLALALWPLRERILESKLHVPERYSGLAMMAALALIAAAFAVITDVNRCSLHDVYRMRLIRAYLGASNRNRQVRPFTGFDDRDNVQLAELSEQAPLHVINVAVNLIGGSRLAWQERKSASFTLTPLFCGTSLPGCVPSEDIGYRPTSQYGGAAQGRPISLGTAMTISGAAASSNSGFYSNPILSFLMTLFNARLGAWLGNPAGPAWRYNGPPWALKPILAEIFGLTNERSNYVFLSDGGHFDNLGVYEMIRRRCKVIIASDAGADPQATLGDLGQVVRLVRADFGVEITFGDELLPLRRRDTDFDDGAAPAHMAVGSIWYPEVRDAHGNVLHPESVGTFLYIKASYYDEYAAEFSKDVVAYADAHRSFPHETTADQFFSESQFESYRKLGQQIVRQEFQPVNGERRPSIQRFLQDFQAITRQAACAEAVT